MGRLGAEREGVDVADDLGDAEGDDVADHALLRCGAGRHPGEVDRVLAGTEVLRLVLLDLRARRLLEEDLRVLRVELAVDAELELPNEVAKIILYPSRTRPATICGTCAFENALSLYVVWILRPSSFSTAYSRPGVVRLRPAAVVVRARIDPGDLERRLASCPASPRPDPPAPQPRSRGTRPARRARTSASS